MSKTGWTPGPWEVRRAEYPVDGGYDYAIGASVIDGSDKQCIAETFFRVAEDEAAPAEANAHLIASAPELYEALRAMLTFYGMDLDNTHEVQALTHKKAEDALRKARGEDQ